MVDLPTPPLPEATAMMFLIPGTSFTPRCTACDTTFDDTFTGDVAARPRAFSACDHLAADRLELALAGIAELDLERDIARPRP